MITDEFISSRINNMDSNFYTKFMHHKNKNKWDKNKKKIK